jgi:hypothetical protein
MGRLEIQIRHGHDPGPSGTAIVLAVLIVLAVVGYPAARRSLDNLAHVVLAVVEVAACVVGGLGVTALAAVITVAIARRRAARPPRYRLVESVRIADMAAVRPVGDTPADPARPALDAPRRPPAGWPLPGQWAELPLDDRGDNPGRYS